MLKAAGSVAPSRLFMLVLVLAAGGCLVTGLPAMAQSSPPAPPGDVVGVENVSHSVADLDRSLGLYRDVLGLTLTTLRSLAPDELVGGRSRMAVLRVPGSPLGVEFVEHQGPQLKAQHPSFVDPGAATLQLRIHDLDSVFPKIAQYPGVKVLTAGGRPVTIKIPNGVAHAVFIQDPDGFVIELGDAPAGPAVSGGTFETTVGDTAQSVAFFNEVLGLGIKPGAAFNTNQQMAATAGAKGASFRQSSTTIPGTSVRMTLIEFKDIARRALSGRAQDPGTTTLQLRVRDLGVTLAKLRAARVPILRTGSLSAGRVALVRDRDSLLIELIQADHP